MISRLLGRLFLLHLRFVRSRLKFQTAFIVPASEAAGCFQIAHGKIRGRAGCRVRQKHITALCTKGGKCRDVSLPRAKPAKPASRAQLVFGFPSSDPRKTYQAILRWRTFSASPYSRWHAFQTTPPRKVPVASGKARRNQTTSAAATPCVRHTYSRPTAFPLRVASALETPLGRGAGLI